MVLTPKKMFFFLFVSLRKENFVGRLEEFKISERYLDSFFLSSVRLKRCVAQDLKSARGQEKKMLYNRAHQSEHETTFV